MDNQKAQILYDFIGDDIAATEVFLFVRLKRDGTPEMIMDGPTGSLTLLSHFIEEVLKSKFGAENKAPTLKDRFN